MDEVQTERTTYSENVIAENERITPEIQRDVVNKLLAKLAESERTFVTVALLRRDVVYGDRGIFRRISKYSEESAPPRTAAFTEGGNNDKRGFRQFQNQSKSEKNHHAKHFAYQTHNTVKR